MTIDEAIKNCLEVAEQNEKKAEYRPRMDYYDEIESREDCLKRALEQRQLAEWLMEVKDLREENKFLISEFDRLIKEQEEQIAKYKRLLKAAIEDFSEVKSYLSEPYSHLCDKWRYADEALKLIEDKSNGI